MKKLFALLLCFCMLISITACAKNSITSKIEIPDATPMVLDKTYTLKDLTYRISSSLERVADDAGNCSYEIGDGCIFIGTMEYGNDVALDITDKEKARGTLQAFVEFYESLDQENIIKTTDYDITVSNRPGVLLTDNYGDINLFIADETVLYLLFVREPSTSDGTLRATFLDVIDSIKIK